MEVDEAVKSVKRDGWRGNLAKEREDVERVFKIIREQKEY
jgi:hypothetical protein